MSDRVKTCWASDRRCPGCGCTLLTNGRNDWCSNAGGGEREKACTYGCDGPVKAPAPEARPTASEQWMPGDKGVYLRPGSDPMQVIVVRGDGPERALVQPAENEWADRWNHFSVWRRNLRRPDPVPLHDGQANTSGLVREPAIGVAFREGEMLLHRDADCADADCTVEYVGRGCGCGHEDCAGHPDGPVHHVKVVDGRYAGDRWGIREKELPSILKPWPDHAPAREPAIGRPRPRPPATDHVEAILLGVRQWQRQARSHRRAVVEIQGDLVVARVTSLPSMIHAAVTFGGPETAEGTVDTLDRAFTFKADHPYAAVAGREDC